MTAGMAPSPARVERLTGILSGSAEPLYAILDAARDLRALNWVRESGESYQSLYEGESAVNLEMFAPYLVRFSKPSPLLPRLLADSWGASWGVYVTCARDLPELRKHLRHFLMVETDVGKTVYFRFYDPRVLRTFLPTATPEELTQFFGPIGSFLVEDETAGALLRFRKGPGGLEREAVKLEEARVSHP